MSSPREFLVLTATVSASEAESFVAACWELGTLGLEQRETPEGVAFKAYFEDEFAVERVRNELSERGLRAFDLSWGRERDQSDRWLREWKASFTGFSVGPGFFIHPSWEPPSRDHPVNILLEPGHAFGTGTHESTRLCLLAIPEVAPRHGRFLDVGTGSGILSIAAAKLRPELRVFALDNDPLAVEMAKENFERNAVPTEGLTAAAPEAVRGEFDLVVANLTLSIFRDQAAEIARLAGGPILVSGFTSEQAASVVEAFRRTGFVERRCWSLQGWVCLLLDRG